MVHVFIDSTPDNHVPSLALNAERVLDERWNGWVRPLATASAVEAFLTGWRQNDPNGVWGALTATPGSLVYFRSDDDFPAEEFPAAGATGDGRTLYDLTGWTWIIPQTF